MKTICTTILALMLPTVFLTSGCEWSRDDWKADFANTSPTAVDIFRNDDLQFTLAPGADGSCDVARDDSFVVRDHTTQQVRGSYRVDVSGDVRDVRLTAIIRDHDVGWSTDVNTDWHDEDW